MKQKVTGIWLIVGAINILPILIWLFLQPLGQRFGGFYQIMTSLGQVSALLGFSLMATTIILTSRLGFIERGMRGLNNVFINHHKLGAISFILLLAHPVALALRYLVYSVQSAALFFVPTPSQWPQTLGSISLALMMILLVITFYLAWRYHLWKFSHRFLALAFIIGTAHVAFIMSDVSRSLFLRTYLLTLAGVALVAYAYRLLVEFGDIGKHEYIVSAIDELVSGIREISLKPSTTPFSYHAGQFVFLSLRQEGLSKENHPFSFVSAPHEKEIKFAIKELGDYTKTLLGLRVGSMVHIEGPYGSFGSGHKTLAPEIWLAGGIGITPFVSMAKSLIKDHSRQVILFYAVRAESEAVYLTDLEKIVEQAPNFRVIPYFSNRSGHLTAKQIEQESGSLADRCFYICGPAPMMRSLKEQLVAIGVAVNNIQTEDFSL